MKTNRGLLRILILVPLVGGIGGCAVFSWTVATFFPKPKIPAEYILPDHKRVLVFSDSPTGQLGHPNAKEILAKRLGDELRRNDVTDETVDSDRLLRLQHPLGLFRRVSVADAAEKLGADLVICVDICEFRVKDTPEYVVWKGACRVRVRVADAAGKQLWPDDGMDGREIFVETPTSVQEDESYGDVLTEELAKQVAERIAQLFYKHRAQ